MQYAVHLQCGTQLYFGWRAHVGPGGCWSKGVRGRKCLIGKSL